MAIPSNSLTGTTANDTLNGGGTVATNISGLAGNDTITLNNTDDYGNGGEGNDSIIFGTAGDSVATFGALMSGEDGNDYISFTANDVVASTKASFMGGKGNDTIALGSAGTFTNAFVGAGVGDDSISIESGTWTGATVKGGDNADTISIGSAATLNPTSIFGAKGADSIDLLSEENISSQLSVFAGLGHDTINIGESAAATYVKAGIGNDSIRFNCSTVTALTVVGGGLADTISFVSGYEGGVIYGDLATEGDNDGNDTIGSTGVSIATNASIYGGGGADTIAFSCAGEATIVEGGSNADRLVIDEVMTAVTIDGGAGADSIFLNSHQSAGGSVLGGLGNDSINLESGFGGGITVDGGAGTDTIGFDAVSALTLFGGDAADLIKSTASDLVNASILGGDGADTIEGFTIQTTGSIGGGAGNDSITIQGTATTAGGLSTLNGGAGTDTININQEAANNSGALVGDAQIVYNAGDVITLSTSVVTLSSTEGNWQAGVPAVYYASANSASELATGLGSISVWEEGTDTFISINASTVDASTNYTLKILGKDLIDTTISTGTVISTSALGFTIAGSNDGGVTITLT